MSGKVIVFGIILIASVSAIGTVFLVFQDGNAVPSLAANCHTINATEFQQHSDTHGYTTNAITMSLELLDPGYVYSQFHLPAGARIRQIQIRCRNKSTTWDMEIKLMRIWRNGTVVSPLTFYAPKNMTDWGIRIWI